MDLRIVHYICTSQGSRGSGGGCPTLYETDDPDILVVQGYEVDSSDVPEGERLVRVPRMLFDSLHTAQPDDQDGDPSSLSE
jgi:hypothetical protein